MEKKQKLEGRNNRKIVSRKDRRNEKVIEQETRGEMEGVRLNNHVGKG